MSQGATDKMAMIDLPAIVNEALIDVEKSIGKVALDSNPNLLKQLTAEANAIKKVGKVSPTDA